MFNNCSLWCKISFKNSYASIFSDRLIIWSYYIFLVCFATLNANGISTTTPASKKTDEVEELLKQKKDHTQKDIEFHTAIAMGSKNLVIPRLIPIINSSIPLFVETTGNVLKVETIETHREIANAIAEHDAIKAQDAMSMHLMYNRRCINSRQK